MCGVDVLRNNLTGWLGFLRTSFAPDDARKSQPRSLSGIKAAMLSIEIISF